MATTRQAKRKLRGNTNYTNHSNDVQFTNSPKKTKRNFEPPSNQDEEEREEEGDKEEERVKEEGEGGGDIEEDEEEREVEMESEKEESENSVEEEIISESEEQIEEEEDEGEEESDDDSVGSLVDFIDDSAGPSFDFLLDDDENEYISDEEVEEEEAGEGGEGGEREKGEGEDERGELEGGVEAGKGREKEEVGAESEASEGSEGIEGEVRGEGGEIEERRAVEGEEVEVEEVEIREKETTEEGTREGDEGPGDGEETGEREEGDTGTSASTAESGIDEDEYISLLPSTEEDNELPEELPVKERIAPLHWTKEEITRFFQLLSKYGKHGVYDIAKNLKTKNIVDVVEYVHNLDAALRYGVGIPQRKLPTAQEVDEEEAEREREGEETIEGGEKEEEVEEYVEKLAQRYTEKKDMLLHSQGKKRFAFTRQTKQQLTISLIIFIRKVIKDAITFENPKFFTEGAKQLTLSGILQSVALHQCALLEKKEEKEEKVGEKGETPERGGKGSEKEDSEVGSDTLESDG